MMLDDLREFFAKKKIVILGFGREGKSSFELIKKLGVDMDVTIADRREVEVDDANVEIVCGEKYLDDLVRFDVIMKSPGISLKNVDVSEFESKIFSQMELLLEFFGGRTIGVTGTKGKSTTSSLIQKILREQNVKSLLLGNIGTPVFEHVAEIDNETTLVLEMSSHQLEFMRRSPKIAVITNIFPEHLDHYNGFESYAAAKKRICEFQKTGDFAFLGENVGEVGGDGRKVRVGLERGDVKVTGDFVEFDGEKIYDCRDERKLIGDYNLVNIMFAMGVAKALGLDLAKAAESVNEFEGLKHRLEFVAEKGGVKYYDNAIGTVPEATMAAMKALGDVDTVIVGGMDRGLDYDGLSEFLRNDAVRNVICMPDTGKAIAEKVGSAKAILVETMEDAVRVAHGRTARGKSCLLSPAAASYGRFRNFEEKGDLFQGLVEGLQEKFIIVH